MLSILFCFVAISAVAQTKKGKQTDSRIYLIHSDLLYKTQGQRYWWVR